METSERSRVSKPTLAFRRAPCTFGIWEQLRMKGRSLLTMLPPNSCWHPPNRAPVLHRPSGGWDVPRWGQMGSTRSIRDPGSFMFFQSQFEFIIILY